MKDCSTTGWRKIIPTHVEIQYVLELYFVLKIGYSRICSSCEEWKTEIKKVSDIADNHMSPVLRDICVSSHLVEWCVDVF